MIFYNHILYPILQPYDTSLKQSEQNRMLKASQRSVVLALADMNKAFDWSSYACTTIYSFPGVHS